MNPEKITSHTIFFEPLAMLDVKEYQRLKEEHEGKRPSVVKAINEMAPIALKSYKANLIKPELQK